MIEEINHLRKYTPTNIIFGNNSFKKLNEIINECNGKNLLFISSKRSFRADPLKTLINEFLNKKTKKIFCYSDFNQNPSVSEVDICYDKFREYGIDTVIGIGGGSALDFSKAVSLSLDRDLKVNSLLSDKNDNERKVKLILIPTTSGTGSELSFGSILTDEKKKIKIGLRGKHVAANYALIDPELTFSLPIRNTMITGFDVLTHAIESFISSKSNSFTEDLSRKSIHIVFDNLLILKKDINNIHARFRMSFASMLMGINLSISSTCLPHRIQYPIGAITNTEHALGLAILYPAWLSHMKDFTKPKLESCNKWLENVGQSISHDKSENFISNVNRLINKIDLNISLQDIGINKEQINSISNQVEGKLDLDPSYRDLNDIKKILKNSFVRIQK